MMFIKKTPNRLQVDPIECGAVALGIILEYFGTFVPGARLRELAKVSSSGGSAKSIIDAALSLGLSAKAHKALPSDIKKLASPAILFFDQCHFVVFEGYFFGKFYINDPALGHYALDGPSFRRRFSRVAITIDQGENKTPKSIESRFFRSLELKSMFLVLGLFSALLFCILCAALGLIASRGQELDLLPLSLLGMFAIILGFALCAEVLFIRITLEFAKNLSLRESKALSEGLNLVPPDFFNNLPFLLFAKSFTNSFSIMTLQVKKIAQKYFFGVFLAVVLAAIWLISPLIAWALMGSFILFSPFVLWSGSQLEHRLDLKKALSVGDDMRAMGQQDLVVNGLMKQVLFLCSPKLHRFSPLWLALGLSLSFFFISSRAWRLGDLTLGEIFSLELMLFGAVFAFLNLWTKKVDRGMDDLIALKREIAYASQKKTGTDLSFKPGDFMGVVALRPCSLRELFGPKDREQIIGNIAEDSDLFHGTLKDNLSLNAPVNESELIEALRIAHATDLFYNRPLGLLSPIWAHGKNLSSSEKKRLLLAQALIKKPDLLLLEDFFSALDEETALSILGSLKALGIATVFTSYRTKELLMAEKVIFLPDQGPNGLIFGDHQTLLKDQAYRELVSGRTRWPDIKR